MKDSAGNETSSMGRFQQAFQEASWLENKQKDEKRVSINPNVETEVKVTEEPDEVEARGEFSNHCEFFLTSLGLAVGLGNLWRFPYVCYENGGGTFLLPYLLVLLFLGLPLYFSEMALGQYAGKSCSLIYKSMVPGLGGLGYAMLAILLIINMYYTIIMAWSFQYMFEGFRSELPWAFCDPEFSTIDCYSKTEESRCEATQTFYNLTCYDRELYCNTLLGPDWHVTDSLDNCQDEFGNLTAIGFNRKASTSEYFYGYVIGLNLNPAEDGGDKNTWDNYGAPQWKMVGCLALSWLVIAFSLIKGMASYGKLSYFVTLFPYVILTTLLIYLSQQDGFSMGIDFYTQPEWERLGDFDVWVAACVQIFYSLGVSIGSQLLLSSYNGYNNNCHRDALLIGLCNSVTSIYAGFVVFGTLGVVAFNNNKNVTDVVTSGTGLAFQVYPEALAVMNPGPLFSFLFFFMLCLLAMSSISSGTEPIVAALFDEFPRLKNYRMAIYFGTCFVSFLGGFSCCFPSGYFMFNLLNDRISNSVMYVALLEMVALCWIYGVKKFMKGIDDMEVWMPLPFKIFWGITWSVITPVLITMILVVSFIDRGKDYTYYNVEEYVYPTGIQVLGWLIELFPPSLTVFYLLAAILFAVVKGNSIIDLFRPNQEWGPRPDRPKTGYKIENINLAFEVDEKRTEL